MTDFIVFVFANTALTHVPTSCFALHSETCELCGVTNIQLDLLFEQISSFLLTCYFQGPKGDQGDKGDTGRTGDRVCLFVCLYFYILGDPGAVSRGAGIFVFESLL